MSARKATLQGGRVVLDYPFNQEINAHIRQVRGRSFDGAPNNTWSVPLGADDERLTHLLHEFGFHLSAPLAERFGTRTFPENASVLASKAMDADIEVPGIEATLYPYQRATVAYAVNRRRVFMAEPQGLGKTLCAIAAKQALRAYPAVIVCPSALRPNWAKEYLKWLPKTDGYVSICSGTDPSVKGEMTVHVDGTPYTVPVNDYDAPILIINYTLLSLDIERDGEDARSGPIMERLLSRGNKGITLDESHSIKEDSLRSLACRKLAEGVETRFCLSGTPMVSAPRDYIRQLQFLGRFDELFGSYKAYAERYCNGHEAPWGYDDRGASHLDELGHTLRSHCFVRHDKTKALKQLPGKRRTKITVEITNRARYDKAENDFSRWIEEKQAELAAAQGQENEKALRQSHENQALAKFTALKQMAGEGKAEAACEWIDRFLEEEDQKLIVFAIHRDFQKTLRERYPDAACIISDHSMEENQSDVDRFQSDDDCRLIIGAMGMSLTSSPAGQGWTLTAASDVLFCEMGTSSAHMEQCEDRAWRNGQTENVTVHYLVANDTIEDKHLLPLIEKRRDILDEANTVGSTPTPSINNDLLANLLGSRTNPKESAPSPGQLTRAA